MTHIPIGWRPTTLGSLGRYLNGRGFKKSEWRTTGRPIIRIQNLTGSSQTYNYFDGDVDESYVARPGDLLVSWAATLGAYLWKGPEAVVNQHIFKVESNIDVKFHKYLLDFKLAELLRHTHGSGMVHITRGKFETLPVVIPKDLKVQRQTVEALETHLLRLEAAQQGFLDAERRTDALSLALLSRLWRESASRVESLSVVRDAGTVITGGTPSSRLAGAFGEGIPFITPSDVGRSARVSTSGRSLSEVGASSARLIGPSAVVAVCIGATIGKVGWIDQVAATNQQINGVTLDESKVSARYLSAMMASPQFQDQMLERAANTTMPILNKSNFAQLRLPLPNVGAQRQLLERLDNARVAIAATREALPKLRRRCSALRRALLTAAFEGRLNPAGTRQLMESADV